MRRAAVYGAPRSPLRPQAAVSATRRACSAGMASRTRSTRRLLAEVRWRCSAEGEVAGVFRLRWPSWRSTTTSSCWTRRSTIRMRVLHRLRRAACPFRSVDSAITSASSSLRMRTWLVRLLLNGLRLLQCSRRTCAGAVLRFAPTLDRLAALCCFVRCGIRSRRGSPRTPLGC